MVKKILVIGLLAALLAAGYAFYVFNKPHEDVSGKKPFAAYTVDVLLIEFSKDPESTDDVLFDKVITIEGVIGKVRKENGQTLLTFDYDMDYMLQAYFTDEKVELPTVEAGNYIKLKCKYSGYVVNDEDFLIPADVKIEKCTVID